MYKILSELNTDVEKCWPIISEQKVFGRFLDQLSVLDSGACSFQWRIHDCISEYTNTSIGVCLCSYTHSNEIGLDEVLLHIS